MKQNCWDFKKCGRGPGSISISKLGMCPAVVNVKLNKSNNGNNGGRSCWVVAGTLCGEKIQGVFAQKLQNCMACDFYKMVTKEEKASGTLVMSGQLLKKLE